jgi:hypothetical protein
MTTLTDAACRGQWHLFDSTDRIFHHQARAICAQCPAITACRQLLDEQTAKHSAWGATPEGTWAGMLVGRATKRGAA